MISFDCRISTDAFCKFLLTAMVGPVGEGRARMPKQKIKTTQSRENEDGCKPMRLFMMEINEMHTWIIMTGATDP